MDRSCFSCKTRFTPIAHESFCAACTARYEAQRQEIEKIALSFPCKACKAAIGVQCKTGSGSLRCAHAPREQAAVKSMKEVA